MDEANNLAVYNLITVERDVLSGTLKTAKSHNLSSNRRNTSGVWFVFEDICTGDGHRVPGFVWCPRCKKPLRYEAVNGTNGLKGHLRKCAEPMPVPESMFCLLPLNFYCNYVVDLFVPIILGTNDITATHTQQQAVQQNPNLYLGELNKEYRKILIDGCVDYIVVDFRPMHALTGAGMHSLLRSYDVVTNHCGRHACDPGQLLPSTRTIGRNIEMRANYIRQMIRKLLQSSFVEGPGGAISLDIWTDDFQKFQYLGVLAHFINENGQFNTRLIANKALDVNESKTGTYLRAQILTILNDYGIDPMKTNVVFVTDRGANIIKALEPYQRHNCGPHFINNVVNEALGIGHPLHIIKTCQNIASKIHVLGKNTLFSPTIKSFCSTRWNTAYAMLESISKNWTSVSDLFGELGYASLIGDATKEEIDDLAAFLLPFKEASVPFQMTN